MKIRMRKKIWTIFLVLLLTGWVSSLYSKDNNESQWKWKVEDLLTADKVDEYHLSPEGKKLVWTITRWNLKKQETFNTLYLTHLEEKKKEKTRKIRLTRGEYTVNSIQWVPGEDHNRISFLTSRKFQETKPGNLWIMNLNGGEPYPATDFEKNHIKQYRWMDKENLVFIAREAKSLFEKEKEENKDTSEVIEDEDHREMTRLFTYNLKTKKTKRLTENIKPLDAFTLSHNKKWVIYNVSMSMLFEQNQEIRPKYYLMNLTSGKTKEIFGDPLLRPAGTFKWAPDDKEFYAYINYSTHPKYTFAAVIKIYRYSLETGRYKEVDLDWDRYGQDLTPAPGGFIMTLPDGVYYKYARYYRMKETWKRKWITSDNDMQKNISGFQLAEDGKTMIYKYSTASLPPRYYLAELKGNRFIKKREVMDIQSPLFKRPLTRREIIRWKGAKDDIVEGILYYPYLYEKGKKYPLILMIHGGPYGADMDFFIDRWSRPVHLLAERGTFILRVNYHGSCNYGLEFGESIAGHYYEYEIPDIENGVEYLIKQGKVDKDKLGIMGWSNGGILGIGLILRSTRYKAASLGAAEVNWTSDYGNCAFGVAFDNYYFGGPPWEKSEYYIKKSPFFQLTEVTTPVLIFHGSKDRAVPYEQGWEFYRALQTIGKAPVRFISFPNEKHSPKKLVHQRRKLTEEIRWFEKYLFNTFKEKNESLKKGSPLEQLAKFQDISKVKGYYGVDKEGVLIPEVVEYKKKKIGRFEVTRAQWAAFDKNYSFETGTGNYPVTNITFKRARQYIRWLNQKAGKTYRLPKEDEIKTLYAKPSGNTFDYWAGYTLNPEDYKNLLTELATYEGKPVLLKPVGSFKEGKGGSDRGDSDSGAMVFDLGGNAAEWVEIREGEGRACGGSAERPNDTGSEIKPQPQYIGFRVLKD